MSAESIWMRLRSGEHLDLLNPDPLRWTDADLAYRLSRTYRWSGDTSWERPLSVAQHSLAVLAIRNQAAGQSLSRPEQLRELLHDAEEGLLGFDPLSPLKARLGADFAQVLSRLRQAIDLRYSIPTWDEPTYRAHKRADRIAAASEAKHVVGWSDAEIADNLQISEIVLTDDPLHFPGDFVAWEPWPARIAATVFLNKLAELHGPTVPIVSIDTDAPVRVLVTGGCEEIEGGIVRGDRDGDGRWDLDGRFTVRTDDGELVRVNGWNCLTELCP